jgi:hypothetical protein
VLGYHPILATRADTREVLHIRLRRGSANTQKGMLRFCDELIARLTRTRASGVKPWRADSGFWNSEVFKRLETAGCAVLDRCAHAESDSRGDPGELARRSRTDPRRVRRRSLRSSVATGG